MAAAGEKRFLLAFDKRIPVDSPYGGTVSDWVEQFKATAGLRYLRGTETVIGQRMTGINPAEIVVHRYTQTNLISTGWRARVVRSPSGQLGETFNIRTVTPDERNFEIKIIADRGGPDG
jgi:head-tail adaptor